MFKKRGLSLVVLVLLLAVFSSLSALAQTSGCYVYPEGSEDLYCVPGILDTEAEADCSQHEDCDLNQHFVAGSNCAEFNECQEITCSVDCQLHAKGVCTQLGGTEVPQDQFSYWCSPGCCKVDTFCSFNLNKYQCEKEATNRGVPFSEIVYDNSLGMSTAKCNQLYCGVQITPGSLTGSVADQDNTPLANVEVSLEGTPQKTTTGANGAYSFPSLNPGTYLVKASAAGFLPSTFELILQSGQQAVKNIVLTKSAGAGSIQGTVKSVAQATIQGATISWSGPSNGQIASDADGGYIIPNLLPDSYTVTASKIGYQPLQKIVIVSEGVSPLDFELVSTTFQGIKGKTYLDVNNNKKIDVGTDLEIFGAKIYVDGIFKGLSKYPDGSYEFLLAAGEHKITASYQDYNSDPKQVLIVEGLGSTENIFLSKFIGECSFGNPPKDVAQFSASHVRGKEEILLEWAKPCPEVLNYQITKYEGAAQVDQFTISAAESSKLDADVEWSKTYKYEIIATYDGGLQSKKAAIASITLGDKACEGRYSESAGWDLFCTAGVTVERKKIWTCDEQNKLIVSQDCSVNDGGGEIYFCSEVGQHNAICKDAGVCSLGAGHFGLYYSRNECYNPGTGAAPEETGAAAYCYYDSSNSTIVNQCNRCDTVSSCFDYKGKDACTFNNCLGIDCEWVDSAQTTPFIDYSQLFSGLNIPTTVTPETGAGYCVEKDYDDDDRCSLCGPEGGLYENYFCTDKVCSSLGACFSNSVTQAKALSYCASCGDEPTSQTNCYTYQFESECTGGQNLEKNDRQEITLSTDQCDWGRCVWSGIPGGAGSCVKDGDGNLKDDCAAFSNAGEQAACKVDNGAPITKLVLAGANVLSLTKSNLTFQAKDKESPLGAIGYCLTSAAPGSPTLCTSFTEKAYPGKLKDETVVVNVLSSLEEQVPGQTYALKFYSKDKYFNQEDVQTAFVYIDNVPPQFEINQEIETVADKTTLTVYLDGTNEPMQCTFTTKQVLPAGGEKSIVIDRSKQQKEAIFKDMEGIKHELTVTCDDNQGNVNTKQKTYTFDLEEKINLITPKLYGAVASTNIEFEAETTIGASCGLYLSAINEKVADFISDENGKKHKTDAVPGFVEREYAGEYKIICTDLFSSESFEEYLQFKIDFSTPATQVILQEGTRVVTPQGYGWEEYFINSTQISFECNNDGFECESTFYCLGEGCELVNDPGYKEFNQVINLKESSLICYYSTDVADNPVYQPTCGMVRIEGYGIILEKPSMYWYQDQKWAISDEPIFPLQFFTRVPTVECKFDFASGFNYNTMPVHKVLKPNAEGKYIVENFPESVFSEYPQNGGVKSLYVQCLNWENKLGPEQKVSLEFDPTKPEVTSASASPSFIGEGITTTLSVNTDDKTVCRFSDDSDGAGSNEFDTMEFSFPGLELNQLDTEHQTIFNINFQGAKKEYVLRVACKNGAGDISEAAEITFTVDYSALGAINKITPSGYTQQKNITLVVETTKRALCEYKQGLEYLPFPSGMGTVHSTTLNGLEEKKHIIPVRCMIEDHLTEASAMFTIDQTPPYISSVNDGTATCGAATMPVMVSTNENNISSYYYEVYDLGLGPASTLASPVNGSLPTSQNGSNASSFSSGLGSFGSSLGTLIFDASVGPGLPLAVPTTSLQEGHKYKLKVAATDAAGNIGSFGYSDGFAVTSADLASCESDEGAPAVIVLINDSLPESCTSTPVELQCGDANGCGIMYGKAASANLCLPAQSYNGQKILFDKSGWLCYAVKDSVGNNYTGSQRITLLDADGDTVLDSCDQCSGTAAGKVIDEIGCASGQIPLSERGKDADKDGLPDMWEKLYYGDECRLDYISSDSDGNTISDTLEDYDEDSYTNYEEYTKEFNPCVAEPGKVGVSVTAIKKPAAITLDVVAWVFLILGLLLVLGGAGYLVHYYTSPRTRRPGATAARPYGIARPTARPAAASVIQPQKIVQSWTDKLASLRKSREDRAKTRARREVFGEFGKQSAQIPHLEPLLRSPARDHVSKVSNLAQRYAEHKEEIKPGLRSEEKGIFAKLENIAKQAEKKDINKVVDKDEAKDIFEKLQKISKKRKG
ncbi:MAG: carboxypeptidase regulatory-like domain-containing protein [Nanoarchaeota archaeon]|nr:carboxypeptidase regulatory-like domain-containing protein [Nanoarchaeota archaeon]